MRPDEFRNPPKQYRPSPFWSWNDDLDENELRHQVRDMRAHGYGGYFMHPRAGMATEYLGEPYMRCIAACLDEGRKVDTESWLYDEDRWPSGFAGGLVPAQNEEYRARSLTCEMVDGEVAPADDVVALFSMKLDSRRRVKAMKRLPTDAAATPAAGEHLLVFRLAVTQRSGRYNMQSYVDLLNPDVTEAFLKCTYDAFYERFGKDYGEYMPGIFTDEPNYCMARAMPWTGRMAEIFQKANGYDIVDKLPLLCFDGADAPSVRYDFWRTATQLFLDAFTKLMFKRCDKQGLAYTGHYLAEDNLRGQTAVIGAAMPHYEYMHVPGIDHLRRNIADPLTLKQVSSTAEQFGRRRVLCENFGCSGHSMSFEDMKWIFDFHAALGVNFMCPHLTLYSMVGRNKRDYPPTFSYHQPYWDDINRINDYMARVGMAMQQGASTAPVLVLHPIASFWTTFRAPFVNEHQENAPARAYDDALAALVDNLLAIQRDFQLGDEMILERHGRVEGKRLVVGERSYGVVVVPPSCNWASSTIALLRQYLDEGGKVVVVGDEPSLVDGRPSDELEDLLVGRNVFSCDNTAKALRRMLDKHVAPDVRVTDAAGRGVPTVRYQHRRDGGRHIFFFCNVSRTDTIAANIELAVEGAVTEWNPTTGESAPLAVEMKGDNLLVHAMLPPVGSRLYVIDEGARPELRAPGRTVKEETLALDGPWRFQRSHANSLPLDYARYAVNGGEWSETEAVFRVRRALRQRFGLGEYAECQPWMLRKLHIQPAEKATVALEYTFLVKHPPRSCALVVERADRLKVEVNGHEVSAASGAWYWDRQFARIDIADVVAEGRNVVTLTLNYEAETNIEDCYVIGDFGVYPEGEAGYHIAGEPDHLLTGDWTAQGYPFYAGNMAYEQDVELNLPAGKRARLRLRDPKGTHFRVRVNGAEAGDMPWQPWETDITALLREGRNTVAIEVIGSLRNTMGPLHHVEGERLGWTGPAQFEDEKNWTDRYILAPYGLLGGAEIVIA